MTLGSCPLSIFCSRGTLPSIRKWANTRKNSWMNWLVTCSISRSLSLSLSLSLSSLSPLSLLALPPLLFSSNPVMKSEPAKEQRRVAMARLIHPNASLSLSRSINKPTNNTTVYGPCKSVNEAVNQLTFLEICSIESVNEGVVLRRSRGPARDPSRPWCRWTRFLQIDAFEY